MSKRVGRLSMFAFIVVFVIATYAVSQLTSLAPRVLQGVASAAEALIGAGYLLVTVLSVLVLGRMIYSSELSAGRVKRRVRLFERDR
ncbi:hypothetical protein [[Eubacterium] cellulosolvens]